MNVGRIVFGDTDRIAIALERIAAGIEALAPQAETVGPCQHPEELRDHAGATMGHPRWVCTGCGYSYDAKGAA